MTNNWINPVAFSLAGRPIYWYGVWFALGFLAAVAHWNWLARRDGRPGGFGSDFGFLVMFTGIVGSRLAYVLANLSEYAARPLDVFRVDKGGLIFYGGFLLATFAVFVMARVRREPALSLLDYAMTGLPLGHALGRVGCFFNGCCYGLPTTLPWASLEAGELRHPAQLYETVFNLALWIALTRAYLRPHRHGAIFALYLMSYGLWRFFIEFLRGDARQFTWGLHTTQVVSMGLAAAGAALWIFARRKNAH